MKTLNYGVIGNSKSAAIVSETGSIDWLCLPNFDSASVFAKILDDKKGGHFGIEPVGDYRIKQKYIDRTNVIVTSFVSGRNKFEVIDFMPRYNTSNGSCHCPPEVVRYFRWKSGSPKIKLICKPKPGYAQHKVVVEKHKDCVKFSTSAGNYESSYMYSDIDHDTIVKGQEFTLKDDCYVMISYNQKISLPNVDFVKLDYHKTKVYWMSWVADTNIPAAVPQKYREAMLRSALVLKTLAYQKTGAILAAITTSLPETIGEVRNWDYRFCWIRDASMTISVMSRLGHFDVVKRFLEFVLDIVPYKDEKIQIMYGIHGEKKLVEKELPWLNGYEGSKPVRIGNAAYKQKQNDIYGVLMDVIYQSLMLFRNNLENQEELWTVVRTLVRHVNKNWEKADRGIWEFRSEKKFFVFSKILCWVAMDRAVKIAELFGKEGYAEKWTILRREIREEILKKGCGKDKQFLTQSYSDENLDAANLLAGHYGFMSPENPIFINTVERSYEKLCVDGLMYRYRNADDFGIPSSSFTVCTFWMIKSLYRIGEIGKAKKLFDQLLGRMNHLGLLSEDMDFKTKRLLGNFPQGYSHLALIDTALMLYGGDSGEIVCDEMMPKIAAH